MTENLEIVFVREENVVVFYFIMQDKLDVWIKAPVVPNYKGVCLQNTSKPHSYHLKLWQLF